MDPRQVTAALLALMMSTFAVTSYAGEDSGLKRLQAIAEESGFKVSELGLWVGQPGQQRKIDEATLWAKNDTQPFVPASLSKLITAAAVLHFLKPNFTFRTELAATAAVQGPDLEGSLYLKGGGDPSFVSESMWALVDEFTRNRIATIEGDLIVDDARFDDVRIDEDRIKKRVDRAYDAPIGAMSMNWNAVNLFIRPAKRSDEPCEVTADPVNGYIRLRNETRTTGERGVNTISVERIHNKDFSGDEIVVRGRLSREHGELVVYKSVTQPDLWSGENLVAFLRERGITVRGKVRRGVTPEDARTLASFSSKPLAAIVADMAKFSNNFVAEMLVKDLAAESGERPATMKTGLKEVERYVGELGLSTSGMTFVSPSGLTRENHLTARQLGEFLVRVERDFTIFPEYLAALPIAGLDGTLRKRMISTAAQGWVRAKTGTIDDAVGLAGFAGGRDGEPVAFAFLYNGQGREAAARALFDRLAEVLGSAHR